MTPALTVFLYGLITAIATGLGALPFLFLREVSPRAVASANAVAGGLMLGPSFGILAEGTVYGAWQTLAGGLLGVVFILANQRWLGEHDAAPGDMGAADTRRMLLIVIVMTVHSFAEGVAVGVSFGGGANLALAITLAQNGYGNIIVLRHQGKYSTHYGHLNAFAAGLKKGARVSQGDLIGYVGMTGWATGPHLHYEFRVDKVHQNPLSAAMPIAVALNPEQLARFRQHTQPLIARMSLMSSQVTLAQLD